MLKTRLGFIEFDQFNMHAIFASGVKNVSRSWNSTFLNVSQFSRMNLFETASIKCKSGRRDADISHSFVFVLGNRCSPRLPKLSRVPKPYPRKEMRLTILPARHTPRKPTLTLLNKESPFCQIQRLPSWSFSNYHFSSDSEFAKLFLLFGFEFIIQFASSRFQKKKLQHVLF